jgi:hypothetical protein
MSSPCRIEQDSLRHAAEKPFPHLVKFLKAAKERRRRNPTPTTFFGIEVKFRQPKVRKRISSVVSSATSGTARVARQKNIFDLALERDEWAR